MLFPRMSPILLPMLKSRHTFGNFRILQILYRTYRTALADFCIPKLVVKVLYLLVNRRCPNRNSIIEHESFGAEESVKQSSPGTRMFSEIVMCS